GHSHGIRPPRVPVQQFRELSCTSIRCQLVPPHRAAKSPRRGIAVPVVSADRLERSTLARAGTFGRGGVVLMAQYPALASRTGPLALLSLMRLRRDQSAAAAAAPGDVLWRSGTATHAGGQLRERFMTTISETWADTFVAQRPK